MYGYKEVFTPQEADIIVLNGGEDIATSIYGEEPVDRHIPFEKSRRDREEIALFEDFKGKGKFFFGICRGGQLLNCLNGGSLYQDVNRHHGSHPMVDVRTGYLVSTTSVHHQAFKLGPKAVLIGLSSESTIKRTQASTTTHQPQQARFSNVGDDVIAEALKQGEDVEVAYYPDTMCLCIQGHPEYAPESKFAEYCLGLINEFFPAAKAA